MLLMHRVVLVIVVIWVAAVCAASQAWAHAGAAPLAFWGEFPRAIARCQRAIGHAASLCPLRALEARADCRLRELRGEPCPPTQVNDAVQAARSRARSGVSSRCNAQQVQILRYIDVNETLTDVIGICRDMDTRVTALSFAPANADPAGVAADPQAVACVTAASAGATRLLRLAIDSHRRTLDRIATQRMPLSRKQQAVRHSRARIEQAVTATLAALERHCPTPAFRALYGREPAAHFVAVVAEAECYGGAVYVQDAIVCPGAPSVLPSPEAAAR